MREGRGKSLFIFSLQSPVWERLCLHSLLSCTRWARPRLSEQKETSLPYPPTPGCMCASVSTSELIVLVCCMVTCPLQSGRQKQKANVYSARAGGRGRCPVDCRPHLPKLHIPVCSTPHVRCSLEHSVWRTAARVTVGLPSGPPTLSSTVKGNL